MDLSVIVPVYNVELYLENCIESLYDQGLDLERFEVLLINDGSTDGSYKLCEKLKEQYPNIQLVSHKNVGLSATRNVGIEQAKGKYIYFLDSDDYLVSGYLNQFLNLAIKDDLCLIGFSHLGTSTRYTKTGINTSLDFIYEGDGLGIIGDINFYNAVWWYIIKKETLGDVRFIEGRLCEDGIFTSEVFQNVKKGKLYTNKVYGYFSNEDSIVRTKNIPRLQKIKDDMFFIAMDFNRVIEQLPREHSNYLKAFNRLRFRQESYLFFALVRSLKLRESNSVLKSYLNEFKNSKYPIYPITVFDGYGDPKSRLLIRIMNNRRFFLVINSLNRLFPIIK